MLHIVDHGTSFQPIDLSSDHVRLGSCSLMLAQSFDPLSCGHVMYSGFWGPCRIHAMQERQQKSGEGLKKSEILSD